jgi:hypothetical protein
MTSHKPVPATSDTYCVLTEDDFDEIDHYLSLALNAVTLVFAALVPVDSACEAGTRNHPGARPTTGKAILATLDADVLDSLTSIRAHLGELHKQNGVAS